MGDGPGKVRALQTKMQEMVEVKVSCQECAVRRVVVFLLQAGGMRENIPW
jgi:hypothetical protein